MHPTRGCGSVSNSWQVDARRDAWRTTTHDLQCTRHLVAVGWTGNECHGIYRVADHELQMVADITARSLALGSARLNCSMPTLQLLVVDEAGTLLEAR